MVKILYIIFFSCLFLTGSNAQNSPVTSNGTIQFYADYSCFKGADNKTIVEVYLMLYADQLEYIEEKNTANAEFNVKTIAEDKKDNIVKEHMWNTKVSYQPNQTDLKNYVVYDQWRVDLAPGRYNLSVIIKDVNGTSRGTVEMKMDVAEFELNSYQISNIEFVSSAENAKDNKNVFTKGKHNLIPNPARRYGVLNPTLLFYYEIYNITQTSDNKLTINYFVIDKNNTVVKQYPKVDKEKSSTDAAIIHGVDVSVLPTGVYKFKVEVNDESVNRKIETSRYFEVIQMDYVNSNPIISEEQARIAGNQIKHLASSREMELYNRLNLDAKAQFLIRFWRSKDPVPETEENELLKDVQKRFYYANENFSVGKTEGWATDRGRTLIKYGMPDEIDNHHSETGTVPYEVWIYRDEKKYEFVFADLQYNGNFILMHSSKEGEVANYRWREYIRM